MSESVLEASNPEAARSTGSNDLMKQNALFLWASGGVVLILFQAIYRLSQISWEALSSGTMTGTQILICALWTLSNIYMEGYRGFHKRFVPRVLARADHLARNPFQPAVWLAPIFSMAFFHSNRRAKIGAWIVTIAVLIAITIVRQLPQPWRGIIDAGVVAGLAFGTLSLLLGIGARLLGQKPTGDPDLP